MRTAVRAVAQPSSKRIACRTAIRFSSSSSTPQTPQSSEPQPPQTPQPPQPPQPKASSSKPSRVKAALLSAASPDQPDVKPVGTSRDPYAVPPLNRPLGSPKQPTSVPKTWAQKKEELLDRDRHKAKRKALLKEASQGYFHDYNLAKKANGGKLWVAPPVLIREDVSTSLGVSRFRPVTDPTTAIALLPRHQWEGSDRLERPHDRPVAGQGFPCRHSDYARQRRACAELRRACH